MNPISQEDRDSIQEQATNHRNLGDGSNAIWEAGFTGGAHYEHIHMKSEVERMQSQCITKDDRIKFLESGQVEFHHFKKGIAALQAERQLADSQLKELRGAFENASQVYQDDTDDLRAQLAELREENERLKDESEKWRVRFEGTTFFNLGDELNGLQANLDCRLKAGASTINPQWESVFPFLCKSEMVDVLPRSYILQILNPVIGLDAVLVIDV